MPATIELTRPADHVALLRLDRPQVRNAMDRALLAELLTALGELAADDELRALVVSTTSLTALSAGADVGEELTAAEGVERMTAFAALYAAVEAFPAPTIAVCVGNVLGAGAELAAGCDLRVGGEGMKLGWVGARLGVPVGPARLVPLVGLARAKDLLLTGRVLGQDEAAALGLVTSTGPADDAERRALAIAARIAEQPPGGLRRMKELLRDSESTAARVATENAILVEWQRTGAGLPQGR